MKTYEERLNSLLPWKEHEVPADIPHGDMPGDKIEIGETHIAKANTIFPELVKGLLPASCEEVQNVLLSFHRRSQAPECRFHGKCEDVLHHYI